MSNSASTDRTSRSFTASACEGNHDSVILSQHQGDRSASRCFPVFHSHAKRVTYKWVTQNERCIVPCCGSMNASSSFGITLRRRVTKA
eukprot:2259704-Pyramimonas_sp.AAC.1